MVWRIAVTRRGPDPEARALLSEASELGIRGVGDISVSRVYYIRGPLDELSVRTIASVLLADPVTERFEISAGVAFSPPGEVEVIVRPGVMEPSVDSILRALRDAGHPQCEVHVATAYRFWARRDRNAVAERRTIERLTDCLLVNPAIQRVVRSTDEIFVGFQRQSARVRRVPVLGKSLAALERLSRQRMLSLSGDEMLEIKQHFERLGRNPTDVEIETLAQSWSEHCQHKTFRGAIKLPGRVVRNLLKLTIFRVTRELNPPWCLSVFSDNSGVVELDDQYALTFKVETHNHPSAIEPYGGAATGIGGVIRDCLGTGLGASPILNTDVFCFAPLETRVDDLPKGVMHPRRIMKGVVAGVRDYGNRMGIPTANGAICFHPGYLGNPLVFCGTLGLIPKSAVKKRVKAGQLIVLMGGRTGRDGIHGVTFASAELGHESETVGSGAVQIGNPIEEKKLADLVSAGRDKRLFSALTDCGGGGLSSAVGELSQTVGCSVELEKVPLKYEGLTPAEIWISESQERMIAFIEPTKLDALQELARSLDVEISVIGRTTGSRRMELWYRRRRVADLDMDFVHRGWRGCRREARWQKPETADPSVPLKTELSEQLLRVLHSANIASREWVIRQYDHEVQAGTVGKPFAGQHQGGPSDGCVIAPVKGSRRGCVVAVGICPRYGLIDPYWMAASAIDEALRNCVAAGGDIERTALLDNFCWGSPERPDQLAGLVRAAEACYDIARVFRTPFISGKDSLYNEFRTDTGESLPIPPTLLISALSVIPDVSVAGIGSDFKRPGDAIYVVGETFDELGGSEYFDIHHGLGREVPKVDARRARRTMLAVASALRRGFVSACHDLSEGGLAVGIAEMAIAGRLGCRIDLTRLPGAHRFRRDDFLLFSESNSRFVCTVPQRHRKAFEDCLRRTVHAVVGRVDDSGFIRIDGLNGGRVVNLAVSEAARAWRSGLTRRLEAENRG